MRTDNSELNNELNNELGKERIERRLNTQSNSFLSQFVLSIRRQLGRAAEPEEVRTDDSELTQRIGKGTN